MTKNPTKLITLITLIALSLSAKDKQEDVAKVSKEQVLFKQVELLKLELDASRAQTQFISARVQADEANKQLTALLSAMKTEKKCELDQNLDCIKEKK